MAHPSRARLNDIAASVPITPAQCASIVLRVAERLDRWIAAKDPALVVVPGLADITLHRDGHLWWYRGRSMDRRRLVSGLGELLDALLRTQGRRVPAGLLYLVARATDPWHLAPFQSLEEFTDALARHASEDTANVLDGLLAYHFMRRSGHPPLDEHATISDVRRLRRAGGVSLTQIAQDTGIPVSLLRELEWGVLAHWDPSHTARSLEAYAKRAGLDPSRVAAIVRSEFDRQENRVTAVVESEAVTLAPVPRDTSDDRHIPLGLTAVLVLCVGLAAPADRDLVSLQYADIDSPAVVQPASWVQPVPDSPDEPLVETPPPAQPVKAVPSPSLSKRVRPGQQSRRSSAPLTGVVPPTQTRQVPTRPAARTRLAKMARAIVGDGRYRVEPFPRVQD
jgi:hypothetical protein